MVFDECLNFGDYVFICRSFYSITKKCDINNNQLMRKKVILQVDKLINRHQKKELNEPPSRPLPEKKCSFDQMYKQAKKIQNKQNNHASSYYHHSAPTSFHQLYDSLKASRNTPKNSTRGREDHLHEKLNHSLEAKPSHPDKQSPIKRSSSSERRKLVDRKRQQSKGQVLIKKSGKYGQLKVNSEEKGGQWEGQEQFQAQWKAVISRLNHHQHEHLRETQCFLNLEEIFEILRTLHYLRRVEDEKLLLSLWQELEGETYGGVPSNNLHQFLTFINYSPANLCFQAQRRMNQKRVVIDSNLKIVVSEAAKLQIYEEYLTFRVNRILYGSSAASSLESAGRRASNIKIVQQQQSIRKKIVLGPNRKASDPPLKPHLTRQKKSEEITRISESEEKEHNEDTICYSENSEEKQSKNILTSNQSEQSTNHQLIEEIVIKRPILSVDVNLGEGLCQKLTVFEGETAMEVSQRLVQKYNIDESLRAKFEVMLNSHIRNLLYRIDEVSQEMFSDREQ